MHHDFPEFLAENHFQLLDSVPQHCTQMRNLIISAPASAYPELPDPLVHGLKIDRLEGVQRSPIIHVDVRKILDDFEVRNAVDDIIQGVDDSDSGVDKVCRAVQKPHRAVTGLGYAPIQVNDTLLNAMLLYIVHQDEMPDRRRAPIFTANSRQAFLMDRLMEKLSPEARYYFIGAIANQLRYPNSHTVYFCYALFHLFRAGQNDQMSSDIQMQIMRVLMERYVAHRPHPWGLIVALLELFKNRDYRLWDLPFMKALPDVSRL